MKMTKIISKTFIIACIATANYVFMPIYASTTPEDTTTNTTSMFTRLNQPFVFFNCTTKNPDYYFYNPATNTLNITTCGTQDPSDARFIHKIAKPEDVEHLVQIQQKTLFADCNKQIVKTFRGKRESGLGIASEEILSMTGIIPLKNCTDPIMVKEYQRGFPMDWVVQNGAQLKALCTYLKRALDQSNIQPLQQKPLLVIEMVEQDAIDPDTDSFLNKYFSMLTIDDKAVSKFFENGQSSIRKITSKLKDFGFLGESFVESIWREIETTCKDFDLKKIAIATVGSIITAIITIIIYQFLKEFIFGDFVTVIKEETGFTPLLRLFFPKK